MSFVIEIQVSLLEIFLGEINETKNDRPLIFNNVYFLPCMWWKAGANPPRVEGNMDPIQ